MAWGDWRKDRFDHLGREIVVGSVVAFNLSGTVAKGIVREIKDVQIYGDAALQFIVELTHDANGKRAGDTSKIKQSKNMMVIA
jgi:hypothetical protein